MTHLKEIEYVVLIFIASLQIYFFLGTRKTISKFSNIFSNVKEELDEISKSKNYNQPYNPATGLDNHIFHEQMQTQDPSQNSTVSAELPELVSSIVKEMPKTFWVGSPQNGVFKESVYEFYKCETIPDDEEGRVYFSFNEAPEQRRHFFEREAKRINSLAEIVSGYANVNSPITNVEPGILKKNPHGEGWVLEKKAKIKFDGGFDFELV